MNIKPLPLMCLFLSIFLAGPLQGHIPDKVLYVPCEEMPFLMHNYAADYRSLSIAYLVDSSPENMARFDKLSQDYHL